MGTTQFKSRKRGQRDQIWLHDTSSLPPTGRKLGRTQRSHHSQMSNVDCKKMDFENSENILSPYWIEKAARELNETEETRKQGISDLRKRIETKGGLVSRADDQFLLRFLRAKKFNIVKAFNMMERYEVMIKAYPALYNIQKAVDNISIFDHKGQFFLDGRDRSGAKIFLYRVGQFEISSNPGGVSVEELFRSNMLCLEWCLLETETQIAGVTILADMTGFKLSTHASLLTPHYSRRTAEVMQETFPLRFKGIHIVNQPLYFDALFAVVKPFLKDKIKQRVFLHGNNFKSLHKHIDPEVLPSEYGGTGPAVESCNFKQKLIDALPAISNKQ